MARTIKVFVVCSGLGRIARGYESFAAQTFKALSDRPEVSVRLFGTGGSADFGGTELRCVFRASRLARVLGGWVGRDSYFAEQATFVATLLPHLLWHRPDVILCSDRSILDLLWYLRRVMPLGYRLLASNGGPLGPPFFRVDFVQHIVEETYQRYADRTRWLERQALVPYAFDIDRDNAPADAATIATLRDRLGLPAAAVIILVAGAVNRSQKRVDYVVSEVAAAMRLLPNRPLFLLMLGQQDAETPQIQELAGRELGANAFAIRTVHPGEVAQYYAASDVFTLGSLVEGFGRVLIEACAAGLPCLVNDHHNFRYMLGDSGAYADFSSPGALARLLTEVLVSDHQGRTARHLQAYQRFSWDVLLPQYVEMIGRCASLPPVPASQASGWPN